MGDMAEHAGRRMRARRRELRLTQPQVAAAILEILPHRKIDKGRVYDWERGLHLPDDEYKPAVAKVLQVEDRGGFGYFLLKERAGGHSAQSPLDVFSDQVNGDQLSRIEAKLDRVLEALGTTAGEGPGRRPAVPLPSDDDLPPKEIDESHDEEGQDERPNEEEEEGRGAA